MLSRARRIQFIAVILALCSLQGFAQEPAPKEASQPKLQRHFLMWKVTSATTTAYLVGSMHIMDKEVNPYPLPVPVEKAFSDSKVLVVEVDAKHMDRSKMQALIQQYGSYDAGDSLSKHLSKETAAALAEFCTTYEVPCAKLEPMRPWVVGITVGVIPMQKAGADLLGGIDMHFLGEVKDTQRIAELETADFQMRLLASSTADEQEKHLAYTLNNIGRVREMEEAYLKGDTDAILKLINDTPFADHMKKVVDERNVGMAEKLDGFLKTKDSYFVVIGVGHVVGDKGVAKLLEQKGYKVERVSYDW